MKPESKRRRQIVGLEVEEVSLVSNPANLPAKVTLFKSAALAVSELRRKAAAGQCLTPAEIEALLKAQ